MFNKDNFVVYTCLMGPNEGINPQPVLSASGYKAICFTDDTSLESSDWEIRILQPLLPLDNHRSQRDVKLRPHMCLREFTLVYR